VSGFLSQGGYAFYVWTAYGLSLAGLGLAALLTLRAYRKAKAALARLERAKTVQHSETNL